MPTIADGELHGLVKRILVASGTDDENAERVADGLVLAELSGVSTHGVFHLARYVDEVRKGEILPTAKPEIVSETPNSALVRGNWTYGFVSAMFALKLAVDKADTQGMAVVGLVEAHHIGRLGEYAEVAAARGMCSQVWAAGQGVETPAAVPYGGSRAVLHTNPIAIGVPAGEEPPMVIDYATTVVSGSKVLMAHQEGRKIAPGMIVDREGNETTDPGDLLNGGAHLPFGGHKGYGIMLADEFLGRVLCGADAYSDTELGGPVLRHQGVTFIVFKADLFQPMADFGRVSDSLQRQIREVPPAPGFDEVLIPGDLEARARADRRRNGIPLPDVVWKALTDLAESVGVEVD